MVRLMKKILSLMFLVLLLVVGCQKEEKEEFYLTYSGHNLYLNKEYTTDNYGQYTEMFENESCAFGDRDVTFIYPDIEIETYSNLNSDKLIVYSIYFTGDDAKTNEGIKLFDEIAYAIKVYGNGYEKDGSKYTYNQGNTSLIFITENDIIKNIEYRVKNIG